MKTLSIIVLLLISGKSWAESNSFDSGDFVIVEAEHFNGKTNRIESCVLETKGSNQFESEILNSKILVKLSLDNTGTLYIEAEIGQDKVEGHVLKVSEIEHQFSVGPQYIGNELKMSVLNPKAVGEDMGMNWDEYKKLLIENGINYSEVPMCKNGALAL